MKPRGQFSKMVPMTQSHHSINKYKNKNMDQRVEELTEELFKVRIRGQQPKVITRSKQSKEQQLKKQIKTLQNQLKKKIAQNPILCRLLKTKNSNQLSHIDLYLEFNNMKSQLQEKDQEITQYKSLYQTQILQNQLQKQQFEEKERLHIQQIQTCIDKISKKEDQFKSKLKQKEKWIQTQTIEREQKIQQANFLINQLQKKNKTLIKELKQLKEVSQAQKYQTLQQSQKISAKHQQEIQYISAQLQERKSFILSLEDIIKEKNSQIQELDKFIQLQKQRYESEETNLSSKYQQKLNKIKREQQKEIKELKEFYVQQNQKLKQEYRQMETRLTNKIGIEANRFIQQREQFKIQIKEQLDKINSLQLNVQTYLSMLQQNNAEIDQLKQVKEQLIREVSIKQQKLLQQTTQMKFLSYQKDQLSAKMSKQNNYRGQSNQKVQEIQRKIFSIGQQNQKLTNMLSMKQKQQSQFLNINKYNQQICGQRYKAIGRITQINHKLEYLIVSKNNKSQFNCQEKHINYYHNSKEKGPELTNNIEQMTANIDSFINIHLSLQKQYQQLQKDTKETSREVQSILSNFVQFITNSQLQEMMNQYLYLVKLSNSQSQTIQKRRILASQIVQILIQLKIIKQYSSQNTTSTQLYNSLNSDESQNQHQKYASKSKSRNFKKQHLIIQEPFQDQEEFGQSFQSDSLQNSINPKRLHEISKRELFDSKRKKSSIRQSSVKFRERFQTQPADIQQKSTYQIPKERVQNFNDENANQSNRMVRFQQKPRHQSRQKGKLYIANHEEQQQKNTKGYKNNIRERLSGKRDNILSLNGGISRQLIEKKYFR